MSLLSPYWENLDKEKGNISLIQKYDCLVEAEIEQHGGLGAKSIQDRTDHSKAVSMLYICVYICENSLFLQESLASGIRWIMVI